MVVRKKAKRKVVKKSKLSKKEISLHHKKVEKIVITALISIIVIAFVVWFSQDFPAQGMAYQIGLELEEQEQISIATMTACQDSCDYVLTVANGLGEAGLYIGSNQVDPYQVVYYNDLGEEIVVGVSSLNFISDGVETVGYLGNRYPVELVTIQ